MGKLAKRTIEDLRPAIIRALRPLLDERAYGVADAILEGRLSKVALNPAEMAIVARAAFALRASGLDYAEIAQVLGMGPGRVARLVAAVNTDLDDDERATLHAACIRGLERLAEEATANGDPASLEVARKAIMDVAKLAGLTEQQEATRVSVQILNAQLDERLMRVLQERHGGETK